VHHKFPSDLSKAVEGINMALSTTLYDALIVGAGPAGLSVALGLSRTHRRAAVFTKPDGAGFRNEGAAEMHNVISRDGIAPAEFRSIAKEQITRYGTVDFIEAEIVDMNKVSAESEGSLEAFQVTASDGQQWTGRKLALAMGSVEVFPDIEGYKENWPENM
jgi:thioredoxin reductase